MADVIHLTAAAQQAGFEMDVIHEPDAAYLCLRVRLPRDGALSTLIDMLTQKAGSGFYRTVPKD